MKKTNKVVVIIGAFAALAASASFAGQSTLTGNSCINGSGAGYPVGSPVINNSSTTNTARVFCHIPLVNQTVTNTVGTVTVIAGEYQTGDSVLCTLRTYNSTGSNVGSYVSGTTTLGTGVSTFQYIGVNFPANGYAFLECTMPKATTSGNSSINFIKANY